MTFLTNASVKIVIAGKTRNIGDFFCIFGFGFLQTKTNACVYRVRVGEIHDASTISVVSSANAQKVTSWALI